MKLSEMKRILDERGLRLTKSLGQNFLHDANQLRRIVEAAALKKSDKILEIGPGLGPLTAALLGQVDQVLAIEKDERLVSFLEERFSTSRIAAHQGSVLCLRHDDALDVLKHESHDWSQWKVVANLPYSVASPILVELAQAPNGPERIVVTLQIEVARRLVAKAGDEDYGLLTLLTQMKYEPLGWFKIPATCFFPQPEVDSACVTLNRRQSTLIPSEVESVFIKVVKRSFSQRRKMMLKLLKEDWRDLEPIFRICGLPENVRAEMVSLEQFAQLAKHLNLLSERAPCSHAGRNL